MLGMLIRFPLLWFLGFGNILFSSVTIFVEKFLHSLNFIVQEIQLKLNFIHNYLSQKRILFPKVTFRENWNLN